MFNVQSLPKMSLITKWWRLMIMTHTLAPGGPASRQRGQAMAPGNAPSLGHLVSCFSSSPSIVLPGNTPLRSTYTNTSSIESPLTSSGNLGHPLSYPHHLHLPYWVRQPCLGVDHLSTVQLAPYINRQVRAWWKSINLFTELPLGGGWLSWVQQLRKRSP